MKYDYGVETRGFSFEYYNVYLPLCDIIGKENVILFDFFSEFKNSSKSAMNKKLKELILSEKPNLVIFCLFEDEFDENTLDFIKNNTQTLAYFFDDPWRQKYVRYWIKHFNFFSTPDYYMYRKYQLEKIDNVIYLPFGYNSKFYKKLDMEKKYDVSFVGGYSPLRKWVIDKLVKEKINVKVFGRGWDNKIKWITQEEIVEVFNQSKINLNLSNSIYKDWKFLAWAAKSPKNIKQLLLLKKNKEQIKGRHYEINGCGGFQLSYFVPGLNLAYEIDKEIAVYEDVKFISDEIKFFLKDDEFRSSIAENGYKRSIQDHSAQNYLKNLLKRIPS